MLKSLNPRVLGLGAAIALCSIHGHAVEIDKPIDGVAQLGPDLFKHTSGWYAGAGLGMSKLEPRINNQPETLDDTTDFAVPNLILGYDINEHWSIEANYVDQGEATFQSGAAIGYKHYGVSGLFYLPHNLEGFSVYLKAGAGQLKTSLAQGRTDNGPFAFEQLKDTQFSMGAGVEYRWHNDWSTRLEALSVDKDSNQLTLNVVKRFGRDYTPPKPVVLPPPPPPVVIEPPKTIPLPICHELKGLFDQIFFKTDSSDLTPASLGVLQKVAVALKPFPNIALEISAHTDAQGSDAYNQALSERRANSVVNYLSSQGIGKLSAKGFGESKPVADNKTAEGRAKNRRVELATDGGKKCE